jgi:hypothetical protein
MTLGAVIGRFESAAARGIDNDEYCGVTRCADKILSINIGRNCLHDVVRACKHPAFHHVDASRLAGAVQSTTNNSGVRSR